MSNILPWKKSGIWYGWCVAGAGMQKDENCCRCSIGSYCGKAEDASEAWIVNRTMQSVYIGEVHI